MPKHLRVLTFLALSLPLAAWAEVPVYDGVAANNGGNVPPSGYGTAGAGGAFAGGGCWHAHGGVLQELIDDAGGDVDLLLLVEGDDGRQDVPEIVAAKGAAGLDRGEGHEAEVMGSALQVITLFGALVAG